EDAPAAEQAPAVARVHDRPAARRDDARQRGAGLRGAQALDRGSLPPPEAGLALGLEDVRNAHARRALDELVQVDERRALARRNAPADGRLAAARQPDDDKLH